MLVELSDHAEKEIVERRLDRNQVIAIALSPEQIVTVIPPIAQSKIDVEGRIYLLRVVFRDENDLRLIITAYRTSQIKKYWLEQTDENQL